MFARAHGSEFIYCFCDPQFFVPVWIGSTIGGKIAGPGYGMATDGKMRGDG